MEMEPELCYRHKSVRGARVTGCLSKKTAYRQWNQLKRDKYSASSEAGRGEPCRSLDTGHTWSCRSWWFFTLGFSLALVQYFFTMPASFPPFENTSCRFCAVACGKHVICLVFLIFTGVIVKTLPCVAEETSDF